MKLTDLNGKTVCILGFGKEGQAALRAIEKYAPDAMVTIADQNEKIEVPENCEKQVGSVWLDDLKSFDVLIKSPGIPPNPTFRIQNSKFTTPTQLFFDSIADSGALVVGVTGSKGKSTTSSLIYAILKTAKKDAHLVGNIGNPALDALEFAKKGTIFVMELSSYQLQDCTRSPHIAVVTSFFPEHLDYHGSLEAYLEAKKHIARFQTEHDIVFYPADSRGALEIAKEGEGRKVPFGPDDAIVAVTSTKLLGEHNQSNIAAATLVCQELKINNQHIIDAIVAFAPLPHRLQLLGTHHGIRWVDDAISTTPDSTIAALDALGDDVKTIILGGQDRGVPFEELGKRIAASSVKTVILFPGSGPRIREAIGDAHADVCFHESDTMEDAVQTALKKTMEGAIVLLSTASPSYGMFKNFEEKGEKFKACILAL